MGNAPEFAEAVESGDMFFCVECNDFLSDEAGFCPECHLGQCENCGVPITLKNLGSRDTIEPKIMECKACYMHGNGISAPCATPATIRLTEALRKCALAILS